MPYSKNRPATRQYFTDAEQGMLHSMCPTWKPTTENTTLLHHLFRGRHSAEAIDRESESNSRCLTDKARGPMNPNAATRTSASPNITPLFTFTPEDTKDLYEAGMKLLQRSQKDVRPQLPSNNTSVHPIATAVLHTTPTTSTSLLRSQTQSSPMITN
jgi:hypothetical protein